MLRKIKDYIEIGAGLLVVGALLWLGGAELMAQTRPLASEVDATREDVGDTANVVRGEMRDTSLAVWNDSIGAYIFLDTTNIAGLISDTASILRGEMKDSAATIAGDSARAAAGDSTTALRALIGPDTLALNIAEAGIDSLQAAADTVDKAAANVVADSLVEVRAAYESGIDSTMDSVVANQGILTNHQAAIDSMNEDINIAESGIDSAQTAIDSINEDVNIVEAGVDSLQTAVDSINENIAGLDVGSIATLRDSVELNAAEIDSLKYHYGIAGDTTSPGLVYYQAANDSCYREHPDSLLVVPVGVAVDSVNKGAVCRFQKTGILSVPGRFVFPIPGLKVVNDSVTAGVIAITDSLRTNTKKMRNIGVTTTDSTAIEIDIEKTFWIWVN